jgi:colanic acid biosynthesis glycosyl transferase WcaI
MTIRILLITTNYWPEPTGIAVYTSDLTEYLVSEGDEVTVLTGLPHYPWWRVPQELKSFQAGIYNSGKLTIARFSHYIPSRVNVFSRARFEYSLWWNMRKHFKLLLEKKFDVVIAVIPTLAAGIIARQLAVKMQIPLGVIVQDLSGVGAKQSGMRGGSAVSGAASILEKKLLIKADGLVVVSDSMKEVLQKFDIKLEKIYTILNYSPHHILHSNKSQSRLKFGWDDKDFIVVHSGNMGVKQDLMNVINAASLLPEDSRIQIYLVGHGNQEEFLKAACTGSNNILLMPAVSKEDYSDLLSASDLLLVNERSSQTEMSLPSKLTAYLFSNRPILAAVPSKGATSRYLDGIAEQIDSSDPKALACKIQELSERPSHLNELAKLGYEFALQNLDPQIGRKKYRLWIRSLLRTAIGN